MKQYVSRRYLKEKWEKLRVDMECVIGVYDDGPDNVAEEAQRVAYEVNDFMKAIAKEMEAEPVKHGRWIDKEDPYGFFDHIPVCSECGCTTKMREKYRYCPNCGSKMDEVEE